MWTIFASSSFVRTGKGSTSWRQCAGVAASALCSGPMDVASDVTSSSRIASSGGVVLPRLGDHHEHGVRQRAAAEVEQFEHLVEARRVARVGRADGEEAFKIS